MSIIDKYSHYLPTTISLLTAFFFASLILFPSSYTISPFILILISLFFLRETKGNLNQPFARPIAISLCLYFILYLVFFFIHSEKSSFIDLPSRALLACCVLALLIKYPPKLIWTLYAIPIGAIISGIVAGYHIFVVGSERAFMDHGYMVIQTGGMAAWIASLSLVCLLYALQQKKYLLLTISILGCVMALYATIVSGARGALITVPIMVVVIGWLYRSILNKKIVISIIVSFAVVTTFAYPQLEKRVNKTVNAMEQLSQGNSLSSSGIRLELWKSALITATKYPVWGYGHQRINDEKARQVEAGQIHEIVLKYERAHNQFLEELQTKGFIGLSVILLVFLIPLYLFYRLYRSARCNGNQELLLVSVMGVSHITIIGGFSLTQHYLNHHSGILLFAFGTVFLAAFAINLLKKQEASA